MSKDKEKEKKLMMTMIWVFLSVTVIVGFAAFISKQFGILQPESEPVSVDAPPQVQGTDGPLENPPQDVVFNAESAPEEPTVTFQKPDKMRGVLIAPGQDFYLQAADAFEALEEQQKAVSEGEEVSGTIPDFTITEDSVKSEVDALIKSTQDLGMNTLFVRTNTPLGMVQVTESSKPLSTFDGMNYLLTQAKAAGLYVYALYDVSLVSDGSEVGQILDITPESIQTEIKPLEEFAANYSVAGIVLEGCGQSATDQSYQNYVEYGAGIGYQQYMKLSVENFISIAKETVQKTNPSIQVGVLFDTVWATDSQQPEGLQVKTEKTDLADRNLDSKAILESGKIDFALVDIPYSATEDISFDAAAQWWDSVAGLGGVPCYTVHAANRCGQWAGGWTKPDQLASQAAVVEGLPNLQGSVFDSLTALTTTARNNANNLRVFYSDGTGVASTNTYGSENEEKTEQPAESETPAEPKPEPTPAPETQEPKAEEPIATEPPVEEPEPEEEKKPDPEPEKKPEKEPEPDPPKEVKALEFTQPTQESVITKDTAYTFKGTADPSVDVMMDGEKIGIAEDGSFSVTVDLRAGNNIFSFMMGEQKKTFTITQKLDILKEMKPTENVTVDGGKTVEISAVAQQGAKVIATVNKGDIPLSEGKETDKTGYATFTGTFTAPAATEKAQDLGAVVVKATLDEQSESKTGGTITVNKKPETNPNPNPSESTEPVKDGRLVKVSSAVAWTFPADKLGKYPNISCYPLPYGTMDYVVGDKLTYSDSEGTRSYYMLASGRRVYSDDIQTVSDNIQLEGNNITGMTVKADSSYTYVVLKSDKPVPFLPDYSSNAFSIDFKYTVSNPGSMSLNQNPLFTSADWNGSKLTLTFQAANGFLGYKAYHEGGNIVFRFNNPTGIAGARIVIDPGHGGSDPGAESFNKDYPEKVINWQMSQAITSALQSRGANVLLLNTINTTTSLDSRFEQARSFDPQILISVHSNSSENSSAAGSEGYYFYPFSKKLADSVAVAMSKALDTKKRDTQYDVFYLTRDPQFIGILSEVGFITNKTEYQKCMDADYQARVGEEVAQAVADFLAETGSNSTATGTQSIGASTGY